MSASHARRSPGDDQLAAGPAGADVRVAAGGIPLPPMALLARADPGTRARHLMAAQRGHGNAFVLRQVTAKPRQKWQPKPEEEWSQAERAHVAAARAAQSAEAARVRDKYAQIAKSKLESVKLDFSALELDKAHQQVPSVEQTKLTKEQVAAAYTKAWQKVFGKPMPAAVLRVLVGKWVAEGGEKGIYGYNVGNVQPSIDQEREPAIADWAPRTAPEQTKEGATKPTKSPFYVFKSLEQGVTAVIYWFAGLERNRAMWAALMFGNNPRDYIYATKGCGYFTAAVEDIRSPVDGELLQTGYLNLVNVGMRRFDQDAAQKVLDATPPEAAEPGAEPPPPPSPVPDLPPEPPPAPGDSQPAGDGGGGAGGAPSVPDGGGGARGHGPT